VDWTEYFLSEIGKIRITNKRRANIMPNQQLLEVRDELLREFMLASGMHKAEILVKILDLDEELEDTRS
jgi:hypothetical protein